MCPEHVFISDAKGARYVLLEQATISPYDHGLLYGDGVFEGIRVYNSRIFKLDAHLNRLYESADAIGLKIPFEKQELSDIIIELCRRNGLKESGYIRPVATRGVGDLGINPKKCAVPTVLIIAKSIQMYPQAAYESGLEVIIAKTTRIPPRSLSPKVKSLNYLNNIQAIIEANEAGVHEAIMLDQHGYVAECTGDNIFAVYSKDGEKFILTPTERCILKGVTRQIVKYLCIGNRIELHETDITPDKLRKAEEIFLTGTAAEIVPVVKVDNWIVGNGKPGPLTKRILELFKAETLKPKNSRAIYE